MAASTGLLSQATVSNDLQTSAQPTTPSPTTATTTTGTSAATTGTPSLQSLYTTPGAVSTFSASTGTASTVGQTSTATANDVGNLAAISNGQINPNDATNAASQLDAITNSNSPYIQQAEQQGLLSAASRGLENSSIGAGAAESSAVAAAAPLAEQNASEASQGQLQNSQLNTQANEFNASEANANAQLNAQLQTQQTQFNASQQQAAAATNSAAQNAMTQQVQQLDEQISQQYLSGSQAQTLASIQGQYNELIASNTSAASMFTSMMNGISATMSNQNIAPDRVASTISADQSLLESGLGVIDALNGGSTNITSPEASSGDAIAAWGQGTGGGSTGVVQPITPKTNTQPA